MAVQFRASATSINDSSSPCTVNKPTGTAEGDMLLLHVHLTDDVAPGVPSGFNLVDLVSGANGCYVYAKLAGDSEPSTYDITFASGTASVGMSAYQSTVNKTIIVGTQSNQTNGSGDRLWPSISTDHYDFCLACFASVPTGTSSTPHSGMDERYDTGTTRIYLMTQTVVGLGATGIRTATGTAATSKTVSVALAETPQYLRRVGVTTASNGTFDGDLSVSKPSNVTVGDLMLMCVGVASDVTVGISETWSLVDSIGGVDGIFVYSRVAGESEPSSYTVTPSSVSAKSAGIIAWRSLDAHDISIAFANQDNTNSDTSHGAPSVDAPAANAMLHCFIVFSTGATVTPDASMTRMYLISATGHVNYLMTQEEVAAGATGTRTATTSASVTSRVVTVAIAEDVPAGPDGAPSGLTATAFDDDRIDLEWTDGSTNEDGFSIERSPNGTDSWAEIDTVAANETTYSDTGLTEYTNYWYRVRAFTTGPTYSDYSNTANAKTLLAAPSGLTATAVSDVQIDLEWTINSAVPPDFTAIERSPNGSTGWTEIATVAHPTAAYSNSQLNPQTTYWYRVRSAKTP